MPYTVSITPDESALLNEAKIEGVQGGIFEFEPRDSMDILARVADATSPDAPGRQRLSERIGSLYGQHLADARKRESEQAPNEETAFTMIGGGDTTSSFPSLETPSAGIDVEGLVDFEPFDSEQVEPPKNKRGR